MEKISNIDSLPSYPTISSFFHEKIAYSFFDMEETETKKAQKIGR